MSPAVSWSVVHRLDEIPPADWDALVDENDPFLEHGFLRALERSGSVGKEAGWETHFIVARTWAGARPDAQQGSLVGAVPLYLKNNSNGEFIFDFAWANGAHRAGLSYFPKLVAAIPFTPVTSARLLVRPGADRTAVIEALLAGMRAVVDDTCASSIHILFCPEAETAPLAEAGYLPRLSAQFHWRNRKPRPYADFDDFLSDFRSRNRKQVRRERAIAAGHGLRIETLAGPDLGEREWRALTAFYRANAAKHDAMTYLQPEFFEEIRRTFAHRMMATFAYRDAEPVAGTLNFERGRHIYGRYWGTTEELDMLHFELCYYRLIERAIARGCTRFEAGAQGEHKLKRGLRPALTHSAHWIAHPELARAIRRFIEQESVWVRAEVAQYEALSPYARRDAAGTADHA